MLGYSTSYIRKIENEKLPMTKNFDFEFSKLLIRISAYEWNTNEIYMYSEPKERKSGKIWFWLGVLLTVAVMIWGCL